MKDSTSDLLAANCDEFIYYEDIGGTAGTGAPALGDKVPRNKRKAFELLLDTIEAIQRENVGVMYSSLVKDTMKRKRPAFSEAALGYGSFSELLEDAQEGGVVTLRRDERSGTYVVTGVASAPAARRRGRRTRS